MPNRAPEPAPAWDLLYSDEGARLERREIRGFLHFQASGRVTPGLVRKLRRLLYQRPSGNLALETEDLAGVNAAFVGQIRLIAREVADRGDVFALVRPGERVRDLLALGGADPGIRILASADELTDDVTALDARQRLLRSAASEVAREVATHGAWRQRDLTGTWLCPLCAEPCPSVRVPDAGEWPSLALEAAAAHLCDACPAWRSGTRIARPVAELRERLDRLDAAHQRVSRTRAEQLEHEVSRLRAAVGRSAALDQDLAKARLRQQRLLPPAPPDLAGVAFGLLYVPAARVGGDFYDFIRLGERAVGVVTGDVSGHGIEGAILMGMAKKVIGLRFRESGDPAAALRLANQDLRPDLDGFTFVTAVAAIIDLGARTCRVARAGHNPVLLANPGRTPAVREIAPGGLVLGMADAPRFDPGLEVAELALEPGDCLCFYTDGIVESENPLGMEFGPERLAQFLEKQHALPPAELLDTLQRRLADFRGGDAAPAGDDLTAIVARLD